MAAAAAAKSLQSCPTLCDPIDSSPPGSTIPGILQARTLEWVAISFSNARKWKVKWSRSVMSNPQWPCGLQPSRLLCPRDFPGKNTGVGCHFLLQEIFPTQGLNPGLPHCRQTLHHLSHQGCPLADKWIRKWYIYTMKYYSDIKRNTFESVLMRWMKLEPIIQNEVSQKEKHQYSILTHIYGI